MEGLVGLPGKNLSFSRGEGAKGTCTALTDRPSCSGLKHGITYMSNGLDASWLVSTTGKEVDYLDGHAMVSLFMQIMT